MTKTNAWKLPWGHILAWFIYSLITRITFFANIPDYGLRDWCQFVYYLVVPICIFYAVAYFSGQYLDRHFNTLALEGSFHRRITLLMKRQMLALLSIVGAYLALSLFLDTGFFGVKYDSSLIHLGDRFSRTVPFIAFGAVYALFKWRGRQRGDSSFDPENDQGPGGGRRALFRILGTTVFVKKAA